MNSKEDIKEIEVNALLEKLEQSDNPRLSDLQALLSDEESADDARMILEYRLAKVKSSHPIDSSREWKKFSQRIHQPKRTAKLFNIRNVFYAVASVAAVVFIIFLFNKYPKQDNSMLAFESNNAPNEILMGDEVGLGNKIGSLVARPAMSLQAYHAFLGNSLFDEPVSTANNCIIAALSWSTNSEMHIWHENDIAIAHCIGHVCHSTA